MTTLAETTFRFNEPDTIRVQKLARLLEHLIAAELVTLDGAIAALAGLDSTAGLLAQTGEDTFAKRTLTGPAAGISVSNGSGAAGNPTLSLANDLAALEALNSTGFAARTTTDTWAQRSLAAPAAGLTIANPAGIAGNPTFALANDLAALEALASTGIAVRSAADTWVQRTITGTANKVTVTNGNGVAGNPTLTLPDALALVSPTVSSLLTLSGGQIAFPATQAASSDPNTLDDYEESTWTPVYTPASGAFDSITYSSTAGFCTKIGNTFIVSGRIRTSALSLGTASGALTITGLPAVVGTAAGVTLGFVSGFTNNPIGAQFALSGTAISLYQRATTTGAMSLITPADMNAAGANDIIFGGFYRG